MGFLASFSVDTTQPHLSSVLVILIGLDDPGERNECHTMLLAQPPQLKPVLFLNKVVTLVQF